MNNKWAEQFAHFEALLSRGSVFTTPKMAISSLRSHTLVSSQPFINLSAQHTSLVVSPADQDSLHKKGGEVKPKQKAQKPSKSDTAKPYSGPETFVTGPTFDIPGLGDDMQASVFQSVQTSSACDMFYQSTGSEAITGQEKQKVTGSASKFTKP